MEKINRIRLLVTSDVHGYIYPYSYADGSSQNYGFAKVKGLMDTLRDSNTLVLDNGDVLEGSPLSFYHFHTSSDTISPMTKAMNEIGYDFVNLGNHDFNYGEDSLKIHLQSLNATCITSNWFCEQIQNKEDYVIRQFGDTKIALFGLVTDYIPHWEKNENIKTTIFKPVLETAKQIVKKIKMDENPDYIVCMYHGGFERDLNTGEPTEDLTGENVGYQLLSQVKGIDILLSGHQHRSLSGKLFGVTYTQTADKGSEIACVDIYPDSHTIESKIISCKEDADYNVMKCVQQEENECQKWLDQTLGTCVNDLVITDENEARFHKSQLITFLNMVSMEASGAQLSSNALFLHATGFSKKITMRNLVSTYVYPNTLVVKEITGKCLKQYLEKDAEFFCLQKDGTIGISDKFIYPKPQLYNYDMVDGIEYTVQVSKPVGSRIVSLMYQGKEIEDNDVYTIVMNNYRASGGGNFEMLKEAKTVKEISSSMVDLLAEYIMKKKVIDFKEVHNIRVIV